MFVDATEFLAHAAIVHDYELNVKLEHTPKRQRRSFDDTSSVSSSGRSLTSRSQSGTETPASSIGQEFLEKIDPRLRAATNDSLQ